MFKSIIARLHQGHRTMRYPKEIPQLPQHFRGLPLLATNVCDKNCNDCVSSCPTNAISKTDKIAIDCGLCIFCTECQNACPKSCISFSKQHRLSARAKKDLILEEGHTLPPCKPLDKKHLSLFKKSLKLRQVSAGGCNACEADINVLSTIGWDIGRFGIQVVASPRHADGLIVTGPVTKNMRLALEKTYKALPAPKIVIAAGACAISGGIYHNSNEQLCGVESIIPVDLFIPGCPPHPLTILDGLLSILDRL